MKRVRFKEISDIKYGRGLPTKDRIEGNYPVFGSNGIIGKHNEFFIHPPVIIIGRKGSVGEIHLSNTPCWPIDTTYYISKEDTKNDIYFLYYLLKNANLSLLGSHSAVPGLNRNDIYRNYYNLPSLIEQKCISSILCSFDKKIQFNTQMNATLEAIGQALFKRWFVDFEFPDENGNPYRSSGGEMTDSELGPIPRGWEVSSLGKILTFDYGKPLKSSDRSEGTVPVYGSNGVVGYHSVKLVDGPGIIVGRKGNPGTVVWAHGDYFPIDTTFYISPKHDISKIFLFFLLKSQRLCELSCDSAVPGLNRNIAYKNIILLPEISIIKYFSEIINTLFERINQNNKENSTLLLMRDTLLPKLMSGEIRVPVEEVSAP